MDRPDFKPRKGHQTEVQFGPQTCSEVRLNFFMHDLAGCLMRRTMMNAWAPYAVSYGCLAEPTTPLTSLEVGSG